MESLSCITSQDMKECLLIDCENHTASLTGSSVDLGPCLTKGGGFRVRASRGDTGEYSYPVGSPGPLGDYGDA